MIKKWIFSRPTQNTTQTLHREETRSEILFGMSEANTETQSESTVEKNGEQNLDNCEIETEEKKKPIQEEYEIAASEIRKLPATSDKFLIRPSSKILKFYSITDDAIHSLGEEDIRCLGDFYELMMNKTSHGMLGKQKQIDNLLKIFQREGSLDDIIEYYLGEICARKIH